MITPKSGPTSVLHPEMWREGSFRTGRLTALIKKFISFGPQTPKLFQEVYFANTGSQPITKK